MTLYTQPLRPVIYTPDGGDDITLIGGALHVLEDDDDSSYAVVHINTSEKQNGFLYVMYDVQPDVLGIDFTSFYIRVSADPGNFFPTRVVPAFNTTRAGVQQWRYQPTDGTGLPTVPTTYNPQPYVNEDGSPVLLPAYTPDDGRQYVEALKVLGDNPDGSVKRSQFGHWLRFDILGPSIPDQDYSWSIYEIGLNVDWDDGLVPEPTTIGADLSGDLLDSGARYE